MKDIRRRKYFWAVVVSAAALVVLLASVLLTSRMNGAFDVRDVQIEVPPDDQHGLEGAGPDERSGGASGSETPPRKACFCPPGDPLCSCDSSPVGESIMSSLERAAIAFNRPERVEIGSTATVELVLSLSQSMDQLKTEIAASGAREGAELRASTRMQATLVGPHFSVVAITPETQVISSADTTRWKWEVAPKEPGRHKLHLTVNALVSVEGETTARTLKTFESPIDVWVPWPRKIRMFAATHWATLAPILGIPALIPLLVGLWNKRRKRRDQAAT